ncbi:BTB/POZ domain-containing protein 19 isoform X3 [Sciurus carolinensis]|uniref:BTB/POZ domain-containing protein 19 isoform X3 n=1 Tax=Sciurus carolinensis TaxID=30640 RepID=UPI001FB43468|nr:BTB/POZ domain-containing protein 19 isoform X3 [Sciurus carolinensis]
METHRLPTPALPGQAPNLGLIPLQLLPWTIGALASASPVLLPLPPPYLSLFLTLSSSLNFSFSVNRLPELLPRSQAFLVSSSALGPGQASHRPRNGSRPPKPLHPLSPCPTPCMETPELVVHGQTASFSTALRSLVNNPRYSDVCFVVGQERQEIFAHRCLLACRCNFFQRLLGTELGPGVPGPVVLSTVPAEAFLAVLEFLYTNSVKLHRHSVLEVLTAAVEYGLEELRELCLEFVVKVLDVELVCEALQVAVTFGLGPLQERCIAFIEAHSQEALRTRGFVELSAAALLPLLRSDKLCVDEVELVRAARSWARVGAAVLERPVAEVAAPVVRELRLALLAPAELSALEEQNRREPFIPKGTMADVLKVPRSIASYNCGEDPSGMELKHREAVFSWCTMGDGSQRCFDTEQSCFKKIETGAVAHACNPSSSGGRGRRIMSSESASAT